MKRLLVGGGVVAALAVGAGFLLPSHVSFSNIAALVEDKPVTVIAFGDMMLDRGVQKQINQNGAGYPFEKVQDTIAAADIAVANAEGPFTRNNSIHGTATTSLRFTFDPALLETVTQVGFDALSQANNHTLDFGRSGLAESLQNIKAAGLGVFGDPLNLDPGPYIQEVRGTKVAFVGYHQFFTKDDLAVFAAIAQADADGAFVIVYPHWGEEYLATTTAFQRQKAHAFIDAGADVVVGAHPHVAEPMEVYKGKAIFYSLGNFIFDQSWSRETSQGFAVRMSIAAKEISFELLPFDIVHAQAVPMVPADAAQYLEAHGLPQQFMLER